MRWEEPLRRLGGMACYLLVSDALGPNRNPLVCEGEREGEGEGEVRV